MKASRHLSWLRGEVATADWPRSTREATRQTHVVHGNQMRQTCQALQAVQAVLPAHALLRGHILNLKCACHLLSCCRLVKEREVEDHLFGDKEKFVTAAYKKKLQEDQQWLAEEKVREAKEAEYDVVKTGHMGNFYRCG